MKIRKAKEGMTLIELIISLALLAILIVPISSYALGSIKNSIESEVKQSASFIGQRFLEEINAYDEIVLKTNGEGKKYFELLDGEKLVEVESSNDGKENGKSQNNNFYGEVQKDDFKLEMTLKEEKDFESDNIDNFKNIKNKTFTLNLSLREGSNIPSLKLSEDSSETKDFSNDLIINLEKDKVIKVYDSINNTELINYSKANQISEDLSDNKIGNVLVIYVEENFSLTKNIEIKNKTSNSFMVYVVKHKDSEGKVNVFCSEGSISIDDETDLFEKDIEGKRYNYSIRVINKNDVIFEGDSSRNLIIREEGEF